MGKLLYIAVIVAGIPKVCSGMILDSQQFSSQFSVHCEALRTGNNTLRDQTGEFLRSEGIDYDTIKLRLLSYCANDELDYQAFMLNKEEVVTYLSLMRDAIAKGNLGETRKKDAVRWYNKQGVLVKEWLEPPL